MDEIFAMFYVPFFIPCHNLRWVGHVARMEESRIAFKILTGTRKGKRPLGRASHRWKDNIKKDLKELELR